MSEKIEKPWSGRFKRQTDPRAERMNASIGFDQRLALQDLAVNLAHSRMLHQIGLLSGEEWELIQKGLTEIEAEIKSGQFVFKTELEDVHMNIEAALIERIGPAGAKIHTARSRNDQVAADLRLFLRAGTDQVLAGIRGLRKALIEQARTKVEVILPGYTHLQRAQPIRLASHLLAYEAMLARDAERFGQARKRMNLSPLGAGALAGTTFAVDRESVARELGFEGVAVNALDAVSDRDFCLDFLYSSAVIAAHLSRLAEELILWSSQEFGFIELDDAFCTGSSIMPQKKNPDVAELIRAKTGRLYGHLMALLTVLKGLPLAYNKDLQEDKEPVFDALDTVLEILDVLPDMLASLTVHNERMRAACAEGFLEATDLADWLAGQGVPFREAHHQVGRLVSYCLAEGKTLTGISLKEMRRFCPAATEEVFAHLALEKVVDRRSSLGGVSREQVLAEIEAAAERLEG